MSLWKRKPKSTDLVATTPQPLRKQLSENAIIEAFDMLGITAKLNEAQKKLFVTVAHQMQLNPLKREIHAVEMGGKLVPVVGYEVYIKRAEATGRLESWKVEESGTVIQGDLKGSDYKVTLIVKRKDHPEVFRWVARYAECVGMTSSGPNSMWKKRPYFMTQKCAIGQGFRLAFPEILLDMPYTEAEIEGQAELIEEAPAIAEPQPVEGVEVDTEGKVIDYKKETEAMAHKLAVEDAVLTTAKEELNAVYHMIKKPVGDGPPLVTGEEIGEMMKEAKEAADAGNVEKLKALVVAWSEQFAERGESRAFDKEIT